MLSGSDVAVVRLAQDAYLNPVSGLPAGFTPMTQSALGLTLGATETFSNGVYTNQNAAALVTVGTLNGVTTLVLAFRGSDDRQDSIADLRNINSAYPYFSNLIAAVDGLASRQAIPQVLVTGHSLGGAMAQLYMASHADNSTTRYVAETVASPGVLQQQAADPRITNLQVADDPAVYLGENRALVGILLQTNPLLAAGAIFAGPEVFPGLTSLDVLNSIGSLNTDYVNRGQVTVLPGSDGSYTVTDNLLDAISAGKSEHLVATYLSRAEALANSTGDDQAGVGITPTTTGVQVFRFFDTNTGTHFYTSSVSERDQTIASRVDLTYEGVGLNAQIQASDPAAAPVFRFFDTHSGSHFYTTSATERDGLRSGTTGLTYEGVAFYENTVATAADTAVYRFFDKVDGTHFYTPNQNEYAGVLATRGDLVNEGIAFYTQKA
ncbi:MAG: lipase family protein [Janthinobacterium lividum]